MSIFLISFYETIIHYNTAFNKEHIKDLLLAPVMTLLFIPYLYILACYFGYKILILRLNFAIYSNKAMFKQAKRQLILTCNFNLVKLNLAKEALLRIDIEKDGEFERLLKTIKNALWNKSLGRNQNLNVLLNTDNINNCKSLVFNYLKLSL
jgi:hypothetical protein